MALPRIIRFLKNHPKPFIAKIVKDGSKPRAGDLA
jgi:hypothetical protein